LLALRRSRAKSSDPHRVCLTRLCCAFRFSQPLDALFRSMPFQPCFMPVTSLGFSRLQRVSPTGSGRGFSSSPVLRAVFRRVPKDSSDAAPRMCAPGGSVPGGAVLPAVHQADPLMAFSSPPRYWPAKASAPCFHRASSHGLRPMPRAANRSRRGLLFRVSENRSGDLANEASLPGVLTVHTVGRSRGRFGCPAGNALAHSQV
jgi:hypothetical protein